MVNQMKDRFWCLWKVLNILSCIVIIIHLNLVLVGSEEVCDKYIDDTKCQSNTCCKQDICDDRNAEGRNTKSDYKCCNNIFESEECSNCPACIECTWAAWGAWSYDPCGDGNQPQTVAGIRHRKHANPGNGAPCPGEAQETGSKDCAVYTSIDCEYENWESWGTCSGGKRYRERTTKTQAQNNGNNCRGKAYESKSCNTGTKDEENDCFPGSSTVILEHGVRRKMFDLQIGDKILTVNQNGELEFSPVILFLHRSPKEGQQFLVIKTDTGDSLTITDSHLMYTMSGKEASGECFEQSETNERKLDNTTPDVHSGYHCSLDLFETVYASDVKEGDLVLVFDGKKHMKISKVQNVVTVNDVGKFAPLTTKGNIVVDDVLASCYAVTNNHRMAHLAFSPVRMWYHMLEYIPSFNTKHDDARELHGSGIHWYASLLVGIIPESISYI